jgi:DNA-binding transcriptional MerR regulator
MKIGEVAEHFGLPTHVLRHWESVGLLSPTRANGGHRRYTQDDLYRVASILRAKQAGLPLHDIHALLTTADVGARKAVLRRNHNALQTKLTAMQSALTLLEAGLTCTHDDLTTCPHFQSHLTELANIHPST